MGCLEPMRRSATPYPVPGPVGGRLIRDLIAFVRSQGLKLPVSSHILIGCSGGADSTALAVLLARYGRRVMDPKRLTLVHFDHGWRLESADDARAVRHLAKGLGVRCVVRKLPADYLKDRGSSWEEGARKARKAAWAKLLSRAPKGTRVWTAHHGDDLAETLLWRLFTGAGATHGGGIAFESGLEVRPFLNVRKARLVAFLKEEGIAWREDSTNQDPRFLRAAMRAHLMPEIERLFPRAVEQLMAQALAAQRREQKPTPVSGLLGVAGLELRRGHWAEVTKALRSAKKSLTLSLPDGWRLVRIQEKTPVRLTGASSVTRLQSKGQGAALSTRWILERVP